ncbi:MAG: trypsin-like peptidase domain-containing protein [Deltaproteobacteria bacterium]|nr:trypsin-like peptidase domain-containing protein [bacterium]MCB9475821.1 trypsin-like peptidase domain-containing protein [Deltaproteobacteria bacterium]MCB9490219.1 trypsin-like peptidase domain-containing protein [Deltaproteobacteria bacterium]
MRKTLYISMLAAALVLAMAGAGLAAGPVGTAVKANPAHILSVAPDQIAQAKARQAAYTAEHGDRKLMIGSHVEAPALRAGDWSRLVGKDGQVSWRTTIKSEGAVFLRALFAELPKGDVFVYGENGRAKRVRDRFFHKGQDVWSPIVFGDVMNIEVVGNRPEGRIISRLSHGLVDFTPKAATEQNCHLDPNCYPDWAALAPAVARMQFESGLSTYLCTGSLIEDEDLTGEPWFLTAAHCIDKQKEAESLVAYWFYQTNSCNGSVPALFTVPTTEGADYVTGNSSSDSTLLKLAEDPPTEVRLPWSLDDVSVGDDAYGIHHPAGAYKRFFTGWISQGSALRPNHWYTLYDEGNTEGGSSGSPLFNADKEVIGTLTGGTSYCWTRDGDDWWGKFNEAWSRGMDEYLGSGGTPPGDDDDDSGGGCGSGAGLLSGFVNF